MALLVFNPDGSPKNELAASECKKWRVSTFEQLTARKARIRQIIRGAAKPAKRSLDARNCGDGAGGFQTGNTCAKGGDGDARPEGGYTDKITHAIDGEMAARGLDPKDSYTRARGLLDLPPAGVIQSIANEQQAQNGKPLTEEAKQSYSAFKAELLDQYNALTAAGLRPIAFTGKGEPYNAGPDKLWTPSSEAMRQAVEKTGDFFFFQTKVGFGGDGSTATSKHPLLEVSPAKDANGNPMLWNDVFRVVHDNVAHIRGGFGFNTRGEMNGMIAHASTLTPAARPALFAETFAQNSVYETTKGFATQNAYAPSKTSMAVLEGLIAQSKKLSGTSQRAMPDEDTDEDMPTGPGRLRRQPHGTDDSEAHEREPDDESSESRNCGTGAGGFQPGNTCAKGSDEPAGLTGETHDARGESTSRVAEMLNQGHNVVVNARDLDRVFRKMAARDDDPDVTQLVIRGTTLFGGEGLGVPRADMPQFGDTQADFFEHLNSQGISTTKANLSPLTLRPIQKEISGRRAGKKYLKFVKGGRDAIDRIVVSRDGYVVDGHHGWAAAVARAAAKPSTTMKATVVGLDHQDALRVSREWTKSKGIAGKSMDARMLEARDNCGTGAGGFQPGNTCAKGGDGESTTHRNGNDYLNENKPTDVIYDANALVAKGQPSDYEGGYLKEGQTLWDRLSVPSTAWAGGKRDEIRFADELTGLKTDPYSKESESQKRLIEGAMPLARQYRQLDKLSVDALRGSGIRPSEGHSDAWIAKQFSSSVTNEVMGEMSRNTRTPEQEEALNRLLGSQEAANSEPSTRVTQQDVDRLSEMARNTPLPEGVTLFHGMAGASGRELLDTMARTQGEMSLNKLTSTTIRPAVAAQFAEGADLTRKVSQEDKTANGSMIHAGGTLGSIVRILGAPKGLPIMAASHYQKEAEVVLAPGTRLKFTGDSRVVFVPAANDSGWPAKTFRARGAGYDEPDRTLFPMKVYDAEVVE
jgi:hypothetical protein